MKAIDNDRRIVCLFCIGKKLRRRKKTEGKIMLRTKLQICGRKQHDHTIKARLIDLG